MKKLSLLIAALFILASGVASANAIYAKAERPPSYKSKSKSAEKKQSKAEKKAEKKKEKAAKEKQEAKEAAKKKAEEKQKIEDEYLKKVEKAEKKQEKKEEKAVELAKKREAQAGARYDKAVARSGKIKDSGKKAEAMKTAKTRKADSIAKAQKQKAEAIEKARTTKQKELDKAAKWKEKQLAALEEEKTEQVVKGYEKGWHKGGYILAMGGLMQADHDKNIQTNRKFDGKWIAGYGLGGGYDFVDYLGWMIQAQYGTKSAQVGDPTGTVAPVGEYPLQNGREHALTIRNFVRYTLTPLANWVNWPKNFIVMPYVKLGGAAHALYIHADATGNKTGVWGGGLSVGGGLEMLIFKKLWIGVDATEDFIWAQAYHRTINGVRTKLTDGGLKKMFSLMGMIGYHF